MAFLNQDEEQQNQNESQTPSLNPSTQGSAGGVTPAVAPQNPSNQPKGSGRFTNIQKYIGANQGAGSRLAGGIDKKIQGQINPELDKTNQNMSSIRQGIQAGQNTLNEGNQIKSQVQDANFDATGYAQDQGNVDKFTQFRTGAGLDEAALRQQAQAAQQQALAAQQKTQELGQQFGTEQGRQQLLKQTFSPGRNYSIGQQRLDNLFLQQASPEIKNIQGNINQANAQLGSLNTQFGTEAKTIEDLINQESGITSGIQSGIGAREQDLLNAVSGKQEAVNKARIDQQAAARDQFGNLVSGKNINQDFAGLVNLTNQDRLLNVLKNDANIDNYLKFNDTLLTSPDQLADQQERAKYDAIARLAGIDPNNRAINMNTQVAKAVDSTGKLRSDIDARNPDVQNLINTGKAQGQFIYGGDGLYAQSVSDTKLKDATNFINSLSQADRAKIPNASSSSPIQFMYNADQTGALGQPLASALSGYLPSLNTQSSFSFGGGSQAAQQRYINNVQATSRYRALMDAYNQLANQGYFQNVNITDPTLEKAPKVT